ncbi:MAG: glycosyltransferase family 4 protein [Bacteroidales bacterium]|nr:glycosyltransferase family 4 protein [Bacteroidales bacterium]
MVIAVNTRLLLKNRLEGIGWFIYENFRRIVKAHPEHRFYFLFDRPFDPEFVFAENVTPVVIGPPARHPVLHYLWFEMMLPGALKKIKPDLFISPDAYNSLASPFRNMVVIHDLNFEHYPEFMPWKDRVYYRYFSPKYAEKADHIVTVSEFTKQDIFNLYNIPMEKITVIPNGAHALYTPLTEEKKSAIRQEFLQGKQYFIFIGALNPRKNIARMLRAFDTYKKTNQTDTKLVIVGDKMYWNREMELSYRGLKHKADVLFTGRQEPERLKDLLGAALALVYVPLFEGFGIPVVEAFHAEVPVISSKITSIPEVAGDAALLVDPFNREAIADAMKRITFDADLRKELTEKGKKRGALYSWDKTAEMFWSSIESVLSEIK